MMTDNTCTCRLCEEQRERERKTGTYWLTPEGRAEIRSIWDSSTEMPLVLLTALEEAESAHASALARAEAAERARDTIARERDQHSRDVLTERRLAEAAVRERDEWQEKAEARQRELNDLEQHATTIRLLFEQRDAAVRERDSALAASASLRERVRALTEGLREVESALAADRKARRPHNARLHARVRALLAPTKETATAEPAKENDHE